MEDIDRVDTDIQALEKEVADLAAVLDAMSAAAVALKGDISRLRAPLQPPQPVELSDDEDDLQESSEVILSSEAGREMTCFWMCSDIMSHSHHQSMDMAPAVGHRGSRAVAEFCLSTLSCWQHRDAQPLPVCFVTPQSCLES